MLLFGPPDVRELAAKHDVKGLIKALGYKTDPNVRKDAAKALGEIGDVIAIEPLIMSLQDDALSVNLSAVLALGKLKDPRAIEPLLRTFNHSFLSSSSISGESEYLSVIKKPMRKSASMALKSLGWEPTTDRQRRLLAIVNEEWAEAVRLGAGTVCLS